MKPKSKRNKGAGDNPYNRRGSKNPDVVKASKAAARAGTDDPTERPVSASLLGGRMKANPASKKRERNRSTK